MTASSPAISDALAQGEVLLRDLHLDAKANSLQAASDRLESKVVRVLLIGEYGRGKSTLINALLGTKVIAESVVPTYTINIVRWAETPTARAGQANQINVVALDSLLNTEYPWVELDYPLDFVREDIELIEFPGLPSDLEDPDLVSQIERADIVVVVLACDALYSTNDNRLVERLQAVGHREIFYVCNFFDRIPSDEVASIQNAAYVRIPANQDHIFFTSSLRALAKDTDSSAEIARFSKALQDIIAAQRTDLKAERAARLLREATKASRECVNERQAAAAKAASNAAQRINTLNDAYEDLASTGRHMLAEMDDFQQQMHDVVISMTKGFIRDLSLKIEPWLNGYKGDNPQAYLEAQIKEAAQTWHKTELERYLHDQFGRQRITLDTSIERYQVQMRELVALLPEASADIQISANLEEPAIHILNLPIADNIPTPTGKQHISITQMPDVLIVATASIAAVALLPLFLGITVGIAGMGYAATLFSRHMQGSQTTELTHADQTSLREKADEIASSVWEEVTAQLEKPKQKIAATLQTQIDHTRTFVHKEITRLQAEQHGDDPLVERLKDLEKQVASLDISL